MSQQLALSVTRGSKGTYYRRLICNSVAFCNCKNKCDYSYQYNKKNFSHYLIFANVIWCKMNCLVKVLRQITCHLCHVLKIRIVHISACCSKLVQFLNKIIRLFLLLLGVNSLIFIRKCVLIYCSTFNGIKAFLCNNSHIKCYSIKNNLTVAFIERTIITEGNKACDFHISAIYLDCVSNFYAHIICVHSIDCNFIISLRILPLHKARLVCLVP